MRAKGKGFGIGSEFHSLNLNVLGFWVEGCGLRNWLCLGTIKKGNHKYKNDATKVPDLFVCNILKVVHIFHGFRTFGMRLWIS